MARKVVEVVVTFIPPPGATAEDIRAYVDKAMRAERGTLHPSEPMFEFDPQTMTVILRRPSRAKPRKAFY